MVGFVSVQGVSTFPHFQVHIKTRTTQTHSQPLTGIFPDRWSLPRAR